MQLMTFIFLVAYHFLFAMYSNLAYVTFIFYLYSLFFYSPVEVLCCKPKHWANIMHYFIFVFFPYFSMTLAAFRISLLF